MHYILTIIKWRSILLYHDLFTRIFRGQYKISSQTHRHPLLNIVYYTNSSDWNKCAWSIKSLLNTCYSDKVRIWIRFDDRAKTPSNIMDAAGRIAGDPARIGTHRRYGGYGVQACYRQLNDMYNISLQCGPNDWVAKCDSDVLVVSPNMCRRLFDSSSDGCGMLIKREDCYFYTGAFFALRAMLIHNMWNSPIYLDILHAAKLRKVPWHCVSEDVFLSCAARSRDAALEDWATSSGLPLLDVTSRDTNTDGAELLHFPGRSPLWANYLSMINPPPPRNILVASD
jgi:hypothetical protein